MANYNILDLYSQSGLLAVKKSDAEYCGPCPFCNGGQDRFVMFTTQGKDGRGRYWCRQCGANGDSIQFLQDLHGLTFKQATAELGIELAKRPTGRPATDPRQAAPAREAYTPPVATFPPDPWIAEAAALVAFAHTTLAQTPKALQWLRQERGLLPDTIARARLGWIPKTSYSPYKHFGMPPELNDKGRPKMVIVPEGLCIPVYHLGSLARVKFRVADKNPRLPKYIPLKQPENARNTSPLFIPCPRPDAPFVVVESELDGLLLAQEAGGFINVLAMGSASFKPDKDTWGRICKAPLVLVSLDFDEAGNKAACTFWGEYLPKGLYKLWPTPEGKDPTDAYKAGWNIADWLQAGIESM